jgi:hypothetical protein
LRQPPGLHVERAAWAAARYAHLYEKSADQRGVETMAREMFPGDRITERLVTRAASVPATPVTPSWAGVLGGNATVDFISSLVPQAASAKLGAGRGLRA